MTSNIFIDTVNLVARAATSGTALPNVRGKLFAELVLNVRFFDGTGTIIPVDVASVILEIKLASDPEGPALLQSSAPVVTGSGPTTLYAFAFDYADGDGLEAALSGATAPVDMICTIQYALSGSMEQIDTAMSFENSYVRPADQASDPVDAERWQWLKTHAPDAGGFAHDDTTRLLSVPGVATNAAAITAEAAARGAADTTLQGNINAEATARASADATNTAAIAAEVTARTAALAAALAGKLDSGARGAANGVAGLNAYSKIEASVLPPPADSETLGGVMRNTGSPGQVVSGINSDGSLSFTALPAGTRIARAHVSLSGHTSADIPATSPPPLTLLINNPYTGTGQLVVNGVVYTFTFDSTPPTDGSTWVDNSYGDASNIAANFYSAINVVVPGISGAINGTTITLATLNTGAAANISYSDNRGTYVSGGGSGTDDVLAGAEQSYALLMQCEAGKAMRPLSLIYSNTLGQPIYVIDNNSDDALAYAGWPDTGGATQPALPDFGQINKWLNGCAGPFYVYFQTPTVGGTADVLLIAEIVDAAPYGTYLYSTCVGYDYLAFYADGAAGVYSVAIEYNSETCGFGS